MGEEGVIGDGICRLGGAFYIGAIFYRKTEGVGEPILRFGKVPEDFDVTKMSRGEAEVSLADLAQVPGNPEFFRQYGLVIDHVVAMELEDGRLELSDGLRGVRVFLSPESYKQIKEHILENL